MGTQDVDDFPVSEHRFLHLTTDPPLPCCYLLLSINLFRYVGIITLLLTSIEYVFIMFMLVITTLLLPTVENTACLDSIMPQQTGGRSNERTLKLILESLT